MSPRAAEERDESVLQMLEGAAAPVVDQRCTRSAGCPWSSSAECTDCDGSEAARRARLIDEIRAVTWRGPITHELVARPNGKTYRARRAPRAEVVDDDGDGMVFVWGTHDVDVATALAGVEWQREGYGGALPGQTRREFCHIVPWDAYGSGYDFSIIRTSPDRGTPCVTFANPRRLRSAS